MVTIPIKTRLEPNGTLALNVSTGLPESDVEVVILVQPVHGLEEAWPEGFFAQTYGAFGQQPLERGTQGAYESRKALH